MKPTAQYILTTFADPLPQSTPVPCAPALDQPHLSSDDQHYKVILENTGIHQFVWEHLNDINHVLQHVKKVGGTFSGWKMNVCIPEVVAVGHHCTYEGHYLEDQKSRRSWIGLIAILSPRFTDSSMWCYTDLGQGFHQVCKAPGDSNQEKG